MLLENIYGNLNEDIELSIEDLCGYLERKSRIMQTIKDGESEPRDSPLNYLHSIREEISSNKEKNKQEWDLLQQNVEEAYQALQNQDLDQLEVLKTATININRNEQEANKYICSIAQELRQNGSKYSTEQLQEMRTELKSSYSIAKEEIENKEDKKRLLSEYRSALAINQNNIKKSKKVKGKVLSEILLDDDLSYHRRINLAQSWLDSKEVYQIENNNETRSEAIKLQMEAFDNLLDQENIKLRKKDRINYQTLQNKVSEVRSKLESPQQYFDELYNGIINLIPDFETEGIISRSNLIRK